MRAVYIPMQIGLHRSLFFSLIIGAGGLCLILLAAFAPHAQTLRLIFLCLGLLALGHAVFLLVNHSPVEQLRCDQKGLFSIKLRNQAEWLPCRAIQAGLVHPALTTVLLQLESGKSCYLAITPGMITGEDFRRLRTFLNCNIQHSRD